MAGIGSAWGSREEMLHPRDRHGRFRKKWKMAASVVDALSRFLDSFQPRTFQSDQQASQYSFNHRKAPWTTPELQRLHTDWDDANESLQAGEMDDTTKKFVDMMDRNMVETTDHLIVSQTVPTEAFGLSPQQAAMEDGGLEDLIGLEIADAGYSAANLGSELSHPPGSVTLRVAVPKGTRVAYGGRSPSDRALIFDRDQPLVVTKVESDGRGGWYMLAIAGSGSKTKGATAVAQDRTHGRRGGGLTPEQREARVSPQMSGEQRLRIAQQNEREMQTGPSAITPAPGATTTPTPAPAAPASSATPAPPAAGVPERREPVLKDSVGPGSPEGKSASDIATDAEAAKVQAENAPPAPPAPPTPLEFQEAARGLPIPTSGPQRNEWNRAHRDLAQGRRDPGDVLRELDTDIEENKRKAASATHAEKKDSLERNIQAQEQLADLIAEKYGVPRRVTSAPVSKKAPTATPGAPSTKRGTAPTVKAPTPRSGRGRTPADVAADIQAATSLEEANAHLEGMTGAELKALADHMEAPVRARATKAQLRQAITFRKGRELDSDAVSGHGAARRAAEAEATAKKAAPATPAKKAAAPAKAVAKKAVPAKAAPSPEDAAEEAFKARVTEAGLPDRVTALRAMARDQKIRGFSTMNKKQLQSALLGDEVPKAGKIAPVSPQKLVPHLESAESDQAARKLLENHTLADLKELAKSRDIEIPKRGATKERLKDMILTDVRGDQEGISGRTPDTGLPEDLGNLGYISLPGDNGDAINREIAQTVPDDPESLRRHRDNLESMSKQFRGDGDKNAANMAQAAADAMGMRAQTISGVEEGAPPVKRVAKKAVPAVPEGEDVPEVERPLEKMLRPELLSLAQREGVSETLPASATKAPIIDAIKKNRRMDSSRGGETDEDRLRRELGTLPGGPERDLGPDQGPLRLPDRAPTDEEILRDLGREAGVPGDGGGVLSEAQADLRSGRSRQQVAKSIRARATDLENQEGHPLGRDHAPERKANAERLRQVADGLEAAPPAPAKKATKKAAKKAVADVDRAAETVSGQLKGTFGDQLKGMDPEEMRQAARAAGVDLGEGNTAEEIFDNTIKKMLESRMRELGMLPEDPKKPTKAQKRVPKGSVAGPKADVPMETADRKQSFREAWDAQGLQAEGAGGRSLDQVRDDVESGKITPEEGVRRLESEISFNKEDIADLEAQHRGATDPTDRKEIMARIRQLRKTERVNAQASKFLRGHVKDEAPVTREELEVKLDPEEQAALQRLQEAGPEGIADMKRAAKDEGLGDIQGDDLDTVVQNISKAVADRELKARAAKKAVPAAAPEAPAAPAPKKAAKFLPPLKDGTQRKSFTHVEVGDVVKRAGSKGEAKRVTKVERGPGGVDLTFEDGTTVNGNPNTAAWMGRGTPSAPEAPAPAKKAALRDEAVRSLQEAGLGDASQDMIEARMEQLRSPRTPQPKAAAPADVPSLLERLNNNDNPMSREDAGALVADLDRTQLQEMAKSLGIPAGSRRTIPDTRRSIVDATVGRRLDSIATRGFRGDRPGAPEPDLPEGAPARQLVESHEVTRTPLRLPPKPVVDLDNPTRHDAELIGTGLDLDPKGEDRQWLDVVQRSLDRGEDGRQIADGLRREADSQRTLHNITESVGGTEGASPAARINRMELMADRLEGVRPIKKAEPPKKSAADEVRSFGTMQAANAASKARSDLRSGKSHAEVATALRTAATGVGSRDHDPHMTSRVGDPTPSEKSAMKRRDAKMLRDLAAEIQAEGVAQRAAAKAAKKAAPAKAPAKKATVNPNLSSLSDDELRKIIASDQFPQSQKDKVQGELDARARRDLTGVTGELIKAQLDDAMRRLQAADNPRLEDDALAGLLAPELKQLAERLGLDTKGSKSTLLQRIKDRVKGREAPGTSAERAVPKAEAPGGLTTQPPKPHEWGNLRGQRGDGHYFHPDGEIPLTMQRLGPEGQIDVGGGESLHNAMGDIATDLVMGRITGDAAVARLRSLATKLQAGSGARSMVARLAEDLDRPAVAMPKLPDDVPAPARRLVQDLMKFPIARATGHFGGSTYETSLIDKVTKFLREKASGESSLVGIAQDLNRMINNHTHESQEGSMGIQQLVRPLFDDNSDIAKALLQWAKEIRARRRAT